MVDVTPQLKRKSEEVAVQRKSKKQRRSEAAASNGAIAGATSTSKSNASASPKVQDELRVGPSQTNGINADASTHVSSTPQATNDVEDGESQKDSAIAPSKTLKQRKRSKRNGGSEDADAQRKDDDIVQITAIEPLSQEQVEAALKREEKKARKAAEHAKVADNSSLTNVKKQKNKGSAKWVASPTHGGWFLPTDPIFSPDEKYLILANLKSVQIYATETSLLANSLPLGGAGVLTSYALSTTKPSQVYVADSNGLITLWDWVKGTKVGRWDIGATVRNMTVITRPESDEDLVYCHETGNNHVINVHALRTKSQSSKTELRRVLKANSAIHGFQVLSQGKYVVLATSDSIMVGKRLKLSKTAVQNFEYGWREIKFSKRITAFSAILREPEEPVKGKKSAQDQRDVLDVAVGEQSGAILLFEDILATFAAIESGQKGKKENADSAESLRPKRLHWHREAVGAITWSLDGKIGV